MLGMLEANIHSHKTFHLVKNDLDTIGWFCILTGSKLSEVRICCISGKAFRAKDFSSAKLIRNPKVTVQGKSLKSRKAAKTRPGVNYAKDCFDQVFLIPILAWSSKGYHQ